MATRLDAGFAAATHEDWRKLVEKALGERSFDRSLVSRSYDGISIQPIYERVREGPPQPAPGHAGRWDIVQRIDHPDPGAANALIHADLAGGASGIELVFAASTNAHGFGLTAETPADLERLLDGVTLDQVLVRIDAGSKASDIASSLAALAERQGIDPSTVRLHLASDPLSFLAVSGRLEEGLAPITKQEGSAVVALMPDGRVWHAGGASEAQELALVIASAVAYLRQLEEQGLAPEEAAPLIGFSLAADADQLLTIAKIRALRQLWVRVQEAAELAPSPAHIHAETAWRMTTARAPYGNMLRATLAAFSAGVGGADSVTVLPFTAAIGLPDDFARRIARNTQTILIEETNAHRVADPAAGSGALEALTEALAEKAWELFAGIERDGGMLDGLRSGGIQAMIGKVREARADDIARRRLLITGVSDFADPEERPVVVLEAPRSDKAAPQSGAERMDQTLPQIRLSEPFEALRAACDLHRRKTGAEPVVFIARLELKADASDRARYAETIFALGGFATLTGDGGDLAKAFRTSGAQIACLCGSDQAYDETGEAASGALRQAGAKFVYLVGEPNAEYAGRGIGSAINVGCNVVEVLREALAHAAGAKDLGE